MSERDSRIRMLEMENVKLKKDIKNLNTKRFDEIKEIQMKETEEQTKVC